jgi:hypothetical protein
MAFRIRDIHSIEEFSSMLEFKEEIFKKRYSDYGNIQKLVRVGKRSVEFNHNNHSMYVKLNFSKILEKHNLEELNIQERGQFINSMSGKLTSRNGKNIRNEDSSCIIRVNESENNYTIQSILFVKDRGNESEKLLFVTTAVDLENRIKEVGRGRKAPMREPTLGDSDDDDDDDGYGDDGYGDDGFGDDGFDDDGFDDFQSGGRTPADDRADSMNPESPRHNPTSRR